jgi:hypothetical protein
MRRLGILGVLVLLPFASIPARADLLVTIDPASPTIAQGGTAQADVYISSDAGDRLSEFNLTFQVSLSAGSGEIYFTQIYDYQYLFDRTNPDYVLIDGGTNYSAASPADPLGVIPNPPIGYAGGTFTGGDFAVVAPGYVTVGATPKLLTVLTFDTPALGNNLLPIPGSLFTIALVPDGGTNDANSPTYFLDDNGDPLTYTSTSGELRVTAVPEPSSLALVSLGFLGVAARRFRRRTVLTPNE